MGSLVKDVMTTRVTWVRRDTPFVALAAALGEYRVSAFPVVNDDGQVRYLRGVVAVRDRLRYPPAKPEHSDVLTSFPPD